MEPKRLFNRYTFDAIFLLIRLPFELLKAVVRPGKVKTKPSMFSRFPSLTQSLESLTIDLYSDPGIDILNVVLRQQRINLIMKISIIVIFIWTLAINLKADDLLRNGDFQEGINHWDGDARSPAIVGSANDVPDSSQPSDNRGLIVKLLPTEWTVVTQEFHLAPSQVNLNLIYKLSPDTSFSRISSDYKKVHLAGFESWGAFDGADQGKWVAMIADIDKHWFDGRSVVPTPSDGELKFETRFKGLPPGDTRKIFCLAFPPGHGIVRILYISLTD